MAIQIDSFIVLLEAFPKFCSAMVGHFQIYFDDQRFCDGGFQDLVFP